VKHALPSTLPAKSAPNYINASLSSNVGTLMLEHSVSNTTTGQGVTMLWFGRAAVEKAA
jgi:hypothetical protein